jgi:transcription initiation factor TFIIH subunit 3
MIAGALTLALSYINRESTAYAESIVGVATDPTSTQTADASSPSRLQSRILLVSASPTTDLAHQYIPIMNAIFACQRLGVPIDVLAIPLPLAQTSSAGVDGAITNEGGASGSGTGSGSTNATVFLQQASDATGGIYLPFTFPPSPIPSSSSTPPSQKLLASQALLTTLLTPLLPSPQTRTHLTSPTQINIDFRAACFCHRRVIDLGYVCSICLSIFCEVPEGGECLTCGTRLELGVGVGVRPVVLGRRRRKKRGEGRVGTPVAV